MTTLSSEAERLADKCARWDIRDSDKDDIAALLRRIPELEADAAIHKARLFEALESEPTLKAAEQQVNDCLHRPTFMDMSKLLDVASANFTERKRVEAERDQLRAELAGREVYAYDIQEPNGNSSLAYAAWFHKYGNPLPEGAIPLYAGTTTQEGDK